MGRSHRAAYTVRSRQRLRDPNPLSLTTGQRLRTFRYYVRRTERHSNVDVLTVSAHITHRRATHSHRHQVRS